MTEQETFILLAMAVGAFAMPVVAGRLGVPAAVAEISWGILLGRIVPPSAETGLTAALAEIGFLLLMFGAGLEIDFGQLEREGGSRLRLYSLVVAGIFGLALLVTLTAGRDIIIALLLAAMSIGVAAAALRELGLSRQLMGQAVLVTGGIGEFVSMIGLTLFHVTHESGIGVEAVFGLLRLGALLGIALVVLIGLRTLVWWFPHRFVHVLERADPAETAVRASIALLFALTAVSTFFGIEAVLAAFLAGVLVAFALRDRHLLESKLSALGYGFFIPVFFIGVGFSLRLEALTTEHVVQLLGILIVGSALARLLPSLLLRLTGLSWRQTVAAGLLLSCPLTLLVAIARVAQELHVLDEGSVAVVVLYAVGSSLVYPIIARRLAAPPVTAPEAADKAALPAHAPAP